jgi:hypothetical protein
MSQQELVEEESKVIPNDLEIQNDKQAATRHHLAKAEKKGKSHCAPTIRSGDVKKVKRIGSEAERALWRAAKQKWRSTKKRKRIGEGFLVTENRIAAEQL